MKTNMRFVCITGSAIVIAMAGLWSGSAAAKTVKACEAEWKANKEAIQASGKKKKDFMAECRAMDDDSRPAAEPATAPSSPSTTVPKKKPTAAPTTRPAAAPPTGRAVGAPAGVGQFASENEAKAHCPGDTVVWANLNSKIYHFAGARDYGNTKHGAYGCEKDMKAQGFRAAKDEKHP